MRILLEDSPVELVVDRAAIQYFPVTESSSPHDRLAEIPGRLSVAEIVNGNNRRYKRAVWEKNLSEGAQLTQAIKRNAAFGLLEHPADGKVDLTSPIAITTTEAKLVDNEVHGRVRVLNTDEGRKLAALIEGGYNPLVSSRGYGTLTKGADGVDEVQDDYVCEGWDVVSKPSFAQAQLVPNRESKDKPTQESNHVERRPAPAAPATPPPPITKPIEESVKKPTVMNFSAIRENLSRFSTVDPTKLTPVRFAETVGRVSALHTEVAKALTEDASGSWEAQTLHDEIKEVETRFAEAAEAPAKKNVKLQETNTKLMRVTKTVAEVAVDLKKKLGESVKAGEKKDGLVNEVVQRGRKWKTRCEALQKQLESKNYRFDTSCMALDIMAKRYRDDITEMGRALLNLEFPEAVKEAKIAEALKKAKTPKAIVAVREAIEASLGKAPVTEKKDKDKEDKDAKDKAAKDKGKKPVKESQEKPAPAPEQTVVILANTNDPRRLGESIALAQRLGKSNSLVEAAA